ncbi:MAG: hypothetical protein ISS23_02840, partial [Nanoarchaeota archaeon]|nr:hypothetical protein [Nanoarchaeota archaeon]
MDILYLFLPGILALGLITSYTDFKHGKIKNKHLLPALFYSILIYTILILTLTSYRTAYFTELIIMLALTLFTSFIIWYVGLWTAGDAKLFFTYSSLIPLSVYKYGYIPYFASTNILINTFIPFALFLTVILLFKTNLKQKMISLKTSLKPKQLLTLAVFLFALIWLVNILFSLLTIPPNYFITIFILFLILAFLEKIVRLNLTKIV